VRPRISPISNALKRAFIFAGGYGTRLRPHTLQTPKPLLPVRGRPIIEYQLHYLAAIGITHVTVNAAYLAEQFESLPTTGSRIGLNLDLSRQSEPLEHGGDLAYARHFLDALEDDERFLGLNGDTIFHVEPEELLRLAERVDRHSPAAIVGFTTERNPLAVSDGRLAGIGDTLYAERFEGLPLSHCDDFGIKILHASVRDFLPEPGTRHSFHGRTGLAGQIIASERDVLVEPARDFTRIEIGTVEDYESCEQNQELCDLADRLVAG
jgi:NDP-sugar pyrophosphorylase family protein